MLSLDLQRILKIKEYCDDISNALTRYGISFEAFQEDTLYQYSVSFCILQIGELSADKPPMTASPGAPSKVCEILWPTAMAVYAWILYGRRY